MRGRLAVYEAGGMLSPDTESRYLFLLQQPKLMKIAALRQRRNQEGEGMRKGELGLGICRKRISKLSGGGGDLPSAYTPPPPR